ncbi:MAG: LysM peptidoglycan-binding domain-containing protein [Chloroflexi bacterium]|nr:LysM peptidoglycan-binding domain-containing protein [Chloroflexota bacterium]MBI3341307.1 LysM peptidoglycan-binding domain-containing protein [Chloroflexota bacterium]
MFRHSPCAPRLLASIVLLSLFISACEPGTGQNSKTPFPTYDPFVSLAGTLPAAGPNTTPLPSPTRTPGPTPTFAPLSLTFIPRDPNLPLATPTPDTLRTLPTARLDSDQYNAQAGDTLNSIANQFGVSIEALIQANNITDANTLAVGQALIIPPPQAGTPGTSFKIIPDSELVYGPASAKFDTAAFIQNQGGYLATYTQEVGAETLTGAQIVTLVSQNYSVNPRLLLALLEHRSKWVTRSDVDTATIDYPLNFVEPNLAGLYLQLTWAARELNRGYYLWRANAVGSWVLTDGSIAPIDPTINAGTAGIENLFSKLDDRAAWDNDVYAFGLFQTYSFLFGNPFDLAVEPLIPSGLVQPRMDLPFERGVTWAFTGGPHGGWDSGSAWAALDFAPSDSAGCAVSAQWVTAVADGFILRAKDGAVIEDLDGDGYEQTGWDVFYMHVAEQDRVQTGTYVYAGDYIGHPSCEGGVSNATHVHIARKYNGEWIAADGALPFVLSGWVSSGANKEYDGFLKRGTSTLEATEGISDLNQISR